MKKKTELLFFVLSLIIILFIVAYLFGAYSFSNYLKPIPLLQEIKHFYNEGGFFFNKRHIQPKRYLGNNIINSVKDDNSIVLLSGYFDDENQIRLIKKDGTLIHKWSNNYFDHFPNKKLRVCKVVSPLLVDIHGIELNSKGEIVFNYEYCGTVKIDYCGKVIWTVSEKTHHSVTSSQKGGYWLLSQKSFTSKNLPAHLQRYDGVLSKFEIIDDDYIKKINEHGETEFDLSISELLIDNDFEYLLSFSVNSGDENRIELFHSNKITELKKNLTKSFPMFREGDLLISIRDHNLLFVVDPYKKIIKWHQIGPWINQHDPEFLINGKISVFNNNTIYTNTFINKKINDINLKNLSNIMTVNPSDRSTEVVFGNKSNQQMQTTIRGDHDILQNGNIVITEFESGRVIEINNTGKILWEYLNIYNDKYVGEIINSKIFPESFLSDNINQCY